MRICIISNLRAEGYGSSTRPYYISKYLSEFGNNILHICNNHPEDVNEVAYSRRNTNNIRYVEKNHYKDRIKLIRYFRNYLYLLKKIRDFNPDVLYSQQLLNTNTVLWLNKTLKKPIIYDAHTSEYFETITIPNHEYYRKREKIRRIEKKVLKKVDGVITVSNETKDYFTNEYNIDNNKISIVKNGTDTKLFSPNKKDISILNNMDIPKSEKICVFTNPRIADFKTNDYALYYFFEIVPEIEKKIKNIKFLIIGGGYQPIPPSKNVVYTGFVKNLSSYINLADVCLAPFPPKAVCGGTRNKICEYFACGKPVVSTKEGMRGFDDAFKDEHYLLGEDKKGFAGKLVYCLNNPNIAKKIGKNVRKLSSNYDWKFLSKKVEKYLKEFIV